MIMDKKKRVLLIAFNDLGHGGIQGVMMTIVRGLAKEVDFDIVVFKDEESYYDREFENYGKIFRIPIYSGKNRLLRKVVTLLKYRYIEKKIYNILIENGPYDVVHSHAFFDSAPCMMAAKRAGVPIRITHSHNSGVARKKKNLIQIIENIQRNRARRIIRENATVMIGCSRKAGDYLFGEENGIVIYNSIDCKKFDPQKYSCSKNNLKKRLLQVGNFCQQKNQLYTIDIVNELARMDENFTMTMIGQDSDYKNKVIEKINTLGLQKYIEFLPHNSNIAEEMSKANCFVFPSLFEGFPLVLMEAQSMGLKCFVSNTITQESNLGLLEFLDIKNSPKVWADALYHYLWEESESTYVPNLQEFSEETFLKKIFEQYTKVK